MRRFLAAIAILIGLSASPVPAQAPQSIKTLLGEGKTDDALSALRRPRHVWRIAAERDLEQL